MKNTDDNIVPFESEKPKEYNRPRIFFKKITFHDGTELKLEGDDIIVFVGNNNTGKSTVLRDLEGLISLDDENGKPLYTGKIITKTEFKKIGDSKAVEVFLKENSIGRETREGMQYIIAKELPSEVIRMLRDIEGEPLFFSSFRNHISIESEKISEFWSYESGISKLAPLFCLRMQTEKRITDSDEVDIFDPLLRKPVNPIQFIYKSEDQEKTISQCFKKAFDKYLIIDKGAGDKIPLRVGKDAPTPNSGEDRTSTIYRKRLHKYTNELEKQGDGMRSFVSVILQALAYPTPSIYLLDEPEAFLHPPQAKLLGGVLATKRSEGQLFVATHSIDILMGLLENAPKNLHIVRLNRDSEPRVAILDKLDAQNVMDDLFLRYSKVLSGLFYKRVVLCEGETDCLFYKMLLDSMKKEGVSDTFFLACNGKLNLPKIAKVLKDLHIHVDIIADIDILDNKNKAKDTLEKTLKALRCSDAILDNIKSKQNILNQKIYRTQQKGIPEEVKQELKDTIDSESIDTSSQDLDYFFEKIKSLLDDKKPWGSAKKNGEDEFSEKMEEWRQLRKMCAECGLWILSVGELERFYKLIAEKKNKWLQTLLEKKLDLLHDRDLREAREFLTAIWDKKPEFLN